MISKAFMQLTWRPFLLINVLNYLKIEILYFNLKLIT